MKQDEFFMRRALELAKRGERAVFPNPMVGAVIVKNGKVIAEGFHKKFGGSHAEVAAIQNAHQKAKDISGSTIYLNLEPCVNFKNKKTAVCADALIKAKISRAVIACRDPNPLVRGKGIKMLEASGIRVDVGCLEKDAASLNRKFFKWVLTGMPYVALKIAATMDGKIATETNDSKWITCEASRKEVKKLRDSFDAVLIGCGTILKDNPVLKGEKTEPVRIILDSQLHSPLNSFVFRNENVFVVTTNRAPQSRIRLFQKKGIRMKIFKNKIKINPLLRFLGKQGISSILVEGGSNIFGAFLDSKCIDQFYWFLSPKIIGSHKALSAFSGKGVKKISAAFEFTKITRRFIGNDMLIEGVLKY